MGSLREAEEVRSRAHAIELMMDKEIQERVRKAMGHLNDAREVAVIVDFYRKLNRPREAEFWENHRRNVAP